MTEVRGISTENIELPDGMTVGHWSDYDGWTGCTVIIGPPETISAGEVRGGGPATRELELLSPATSTPGAHAVLLSGGSAFGLGAVDGVVAWHKERGLGLPTPVGPVPLVSGGACFDLPVGDPEAFPGPDAGRAACDAAGSTFERGCVGAGTGCTAGKVSFEGCTKSGLGAATLRVGDAILTAIAVVNPYGEVTGSDGEVIAGNWQDGAYRRTVDVLLETPQKMPLGENTTLVCLVTDAKLTKNEAWVAARSAAPGFGRALSPAATAVDGDMTMCMSTGKVEVDPFLFSIFAAEVTAEAIRDGARRATDGGGVPAASSRVS